jgi:hypothetical protein
MTVNNLPKFLNFACRVAMPHRANDRRQNRHGSGVPMLTMIIGYSIGNGVNARQGNEPTNVFGAKPKK